MNIKASSFPLSFSHLILSLQSLRSSCASAYSKLHSLGTYKILIYQTKWPPKSPFPSSCSETSASSALPSPNTQLTPTQNLHNNPPTNPHLRHPRRARRRPLRLRRHHLRRPALRPRKFPQSQHSRRRRGLPQCGRPYGACDQRHPSVRWLLWLD